MTTWSCPIRPGENRCPDCGAEPLVSCSTCPGWGGAFAAGDLADRFFRGGPEPLTPQPVGAVRAPPCFRVRAARRLPGGNRMTLSDLPRRERRGSRARCVVFTQGQPHDVASRLERIAAPYARIEAEQHVWMPRGFEAPSEARLGEAEGLLDPERREIVTDWWLAVRQHANTPNWDIASTATMIAPTWTSSSGIRAARSSPRTTRRTPSPLLQPRSARAVVTG